MFMRFKQFLPQGSLDGKVKMKLPDSATFQDLLRTIGMPAAEDKIIVINGISHKQSAAVNAVVLHEGDTVAIFPPIAGG